MHHVSFLGALAIAGAGAFAGWINAIVGSGSLVTFPTLIALGFTPLVANVSNNVGMVFGNFSGVHGYRRELVGQGERLRRLLPWSLAGGALGAGLLLAHPSTFRSVVPFLVLLGVAMVIVQPRITAYLQSRSDPRETGGGWLRAGIFLVGAYGGYFGAAQGVLLIAMLAMSLDDQLQRLNGLKNVLAAGVNFVAAVLFVALAPVDWTVVAILGVSSIVGGQLGAHVGRRLPAPVLRAVIVVGGTAAAVHLFMTS